MLMNLISPKARVNALPSCEDGLIPFSFVSTQHQRMTHGRITWAAPQKTK